MYVKKEKKMQFDTVEKKKNIHNHLSIFLFHCVHCIRLKQCEM